MEEPNIGGVSRQGIALARYLDRISRQGNELTVTIKCWPTPPYVWRVEVDCRERLSEMDIDPRGRITPPGGRR